MRKLNNIQQFPLGTAEIASYLYPARGKASARNEGGALHAAPPCEPPSRREFSTKIIFHILFCGLLLLPWFTAQAAEKTATGIPAKSLTQALKLAGVRPQYLERNIIVYKVESTYCHTSDANGDGLMAYDCLLNQIFSIAGAPAKVLYDAMVSLNMPVDAGMSQTRVTAQQVHCRIDPSATAINQCNWSSQ